MPKKSFKDIGAQAARAFITIEPPEQAQALPESTPAPGIPPEMDIPPELSAQPVMLPQPPRKAGRPRTNQRVLTKSSQENLPDNWTRATFIVREDLLDAFKEHSAQAGITIKVAINTALEQYLNGGNL